MIARLLLTLSVLFVCSSVLPQSGSAVIGMGYGFNTGTVYAPYSYGKTHQGHGLGLHIGAAWDNGGDTHSHFRIRLLWQRYWWSESFTSHTTTYDQYGFQAKEYEGSVDSRIDQLTATPFLVIPVRPKLRLLFGADLSIALASRVHDRTLTRYSSAWSSGHTYIEYTDSSLVDTVGKGFKYVNEYQFAIPLGVEVDILRNLRFTAEFSVGAGRLVAGRPPRYARLMISYVFGRKSAKSPVENSPPDRS